MCTTCHAEIISNALVQTGVESEGGRQGGSNKLQKMKKNRIFLFFSWFFLGFPGFSLVFLKVFSLKFPPLSPQTVFSDVKRENPLIPPLPNGTAKLYVLSP